MDQETIVLTNHGWAAAAFLYLKQQGLVRADQEAAVRAVLAPIFENAERNAFERAMNTHPGKG